MEQRVRVEKRRKRGNRNIGFKNTHYIRDLDTENSKGL